MTNVDHLTKGASMTNVDHLTKGASMESCWLECP
jgi:hypothetical protein